jgi:hypothetical protein
VNLDAALAIPGGSNLADTAAILINPSAPTTVSTVVVNLNATQRSRLTTIEVTFSAPVNAATYTGPGAITLTRTNSGPATVVQTGAKGANGRILVAPLSGMVTTLTLTFDNADGSGVTDGVEHTSLADGRWQLAIPANGYTSPLNGADIRRRFGEINNDLTVDGADLTILGNNFGTSFAPLDWDNNGTIDGSDLTQFGNRFGTTI